MPRQTKPLINFRGDRWSPVVGRAIERKLNRHRAVIVATGGLDNKTETDALINDLATELRRAWSVLRDINRAGSDAQIYRTLEALLKQSTPLEQVIWLIDPATRAVIEEAHPDGLLAIEQESIDPERLHLAIQMAFAARETPKSHRPPQTPNFAMQVLAKGLAEAYARHVRPPTRHFDYSTHQESGPYHAFIKLIVGLIPIRLRKTSKGGIPTIDYLVRLGVNHYNSTKR